MAANPRRVIPGRRLTTAGFVGAGTALVAIAGRSLIAGSLALDLNVGRRRRELGPIELMIAASPERTFDVIAKPYVDDSSPSSSVALLERGAGYALAAHLTPINRSLTAKTVELVQLDRPHRLTFRLIRGPVADGRETFDLREVDGQTELTYRGHLEADLWGLGSRWLDGVAGRWEAAVRSTLERVRRESERDDAAAPH